MKLTRRELNKLCSFAAVSVFMPFSIIGCGVDAIISGLEVGLSVLSAAAGIAGLNPLIVLALTKVGAIVRDVTNGYADYEKAEANLKPGKLSTLEAAITAAQNNLAQILADTGVKNSELVKYITTAVAVANSAIMALVTKLGTPTLTKVSAARGLSRPLPTIPNAKSANDLKKAWNDAVKAEHPEAVIR